MFLQTIDTFTSVHDYLFLAMYRIDISTKRVILLSYYMIMTWFGG